MMKTHKLNRTKFIAIALAFSCFQNAFAQIANIWKGGFPGQENNWECPKNWSRNAAPDEFSDVIIPDVSASTFASPVIRAGDITINALTLQNNAVLTILSTAKLTVLLHADGVNASNVRGTGSFVVQECAARNSRNRANESNQWTTYERSNIGRN